MVISCPSCNRRYQIDTTRIPAGGTSFTCWSCRATVPIAAPSGARLEPEPRPEAEPPRAPEPAPGGEAQGGSGASSVPPAALRFFESLAAEASTRRGPAVRPPRASAPLPGGEDSGEGAGTGDRFVPAAATAPRGLPPESAGAAPVEVVRASGGTLDLFSGDDVLDLPPVELASAPSAGDVIDLGIGNPPPASAAPEPYAERAPFATPPPPAESPSGGSTPTLDLSSAPAPTVDLGSTAPEPSPAQPPVAQQPASSAHEADPLVPVVAPAPSVAPADPPAADAPAFAWSQPAAPLAEAPRPEIPVAPRPEPQRNGGVSPAEMAAREWASRGFGEPESERPRRRAWLFAAALVVIAGVAAAAWLAWRSPSPGRAAAASQSERAAAPSAAPSSAPAPAEAPVATPEAATPAAAPSAAPAGAEPTAADAPASTAPSAEPAFTIQVRSSRDEAESRAVAESLEKAGFDAYVQAADLGARGRWYRVRVGRFSGRAEAQQQLARLRSSGAGRDAIVVAYEAR